MASISEPVVFDQLFALTTSSRSSALHLEAIGTIPDASRVLSGERTPPGRIRFGRYSGSKAYDLLGESYATFKIVSPRFVQLLRDLEATGWNTLPVEIAGAKGEAIEGYSLLVVTGRAGPIDRRRTRIVRVDPPVPAGAPTYSERGLFFDPASWDGSDLFLPAETAVVGVTNRIKAATEDRKLTNVRFLPLTEYEVMLYSEYPAHRRG